MKMCIPFEIVTDSHAQNFGALYYLEALVIVSCDVVFSEGSIGKVNLELFTCRCV